MKSRLGGGKEWTLGVFRGGPMSSSKWKGREAGSHPERRFQFQKVSPTDMGFMGNPHSSAPGGAEQISVNIH